MMAEIVIDSEMTVGWHRQHDFRQEFFERRVLVAKLMACVNRKAGRHARNKRQPEDSKYAEIS